MQTNNKYQMELFVLKYLEPFNCVQTKLIFVCKQISYDSFKKILPTNYLLTNHIYVKSIENKQTLGHLKMLSKNYAFTNHMGCINRVWFVFFV